MSRRWVMPPARPVSRELLTPRAGRVLPAVRPRKPWWADRAADAAVVPAAVAWVIGMVTLAGAFLR